MDTYVLDANAIRKLSYDDIKIACQKARVITTDDILWEVWDLQKARLIPCVEMTKLSYSRIAELLSTRADVRKLVDYYNNKGAADVAVLAYILTANEGKLLPDNIILVTDDNDLITACSGEGIKTLCPADFRCQVMDTSPSKRSTRDTVV